MVGSATELAQLEVFDWDGMLKWTGLLRKFEILHKIFVEVDLEEPILSSFTVINELCIFEFLLDRSQVPLWNGDSHVVIESSDSLVVRDWDVVQFGKVSQNLPLSFRGSAELDFTEVEEQGGFRFDLDGFVKFENIICHQVIVPDRVN